MTAPGRSPRAAMVAAFALLVVGCSGSPTAVEDRGIPDPAPPASAQEDFPDMDSTGDMVLIGASYAGGWDLSAAGTLRVVNRGVDGEQSWQMLDRFETDVISVSPRAVLIWGYINDVHRNDPAKIEQTVARVQESFRRMVDLAVENGIEPVVATEVTLVVPDDLRSRLLGLVGRIRGKESYRRFVNRNVMGLNDWLRAYAAERDVLLLDLHAVLSDENGARRPAFAKEDGSHIPEAGYRALTSYAKPILDLRFGKS